MATPLTVIDLFAGAGGLSLGFRQAGGFETVAAVEKEHSAAATYRANNPRVELYAGDISQWLNARVPRADIVVGGPPCQGFSALGSRRARDPRNALWRRYVDTLQAVRPFAFVMENVADFLKSGQFDGLRRETGPRGSLANYRIEAFVLNAAHFGAPQLRKRAIVIGTQRELRPVGQPLGNRADPERWSTVRDAIGDLPGAVDGIDLPRPREGTSLPGPFRSYELHLGRRPTQLSMARYASIPPGGNRKNIPDHLLAPCWRSHQAGSGDVMGRLRWDHPSVTIRTEFWKPEKGRYLHPEQDRPISHLEAARLQGFPDDYHWYGSKADIGRQIGNAVPIALARGIARELKKQFG